MGRRRHRCFELDGARVHGDPDMPDEAREALAQVIAAARRQAEEIPYMLEDTREEFERVRDLAWPEADEHAFREQAGAAPPADYVPPDDGPTDHVPEDDDYLGMELDQLREQCPWYRTRGLPDAQRGVCIFGCRSEPVCETG